MFLMVTHTQKKNLLLKKLLQVMQNGLF